MKIREKELERKRKDIEDRTAKLERARMADTLMPEVKRLEDEVSNLEDLKRRRMLQAGELERVLWRELPDPPDIRRVQRLREQVKADREAGRRPGRSGLGGFGPAGGQRLRDVGYYTLIPRVLAAGPLLGYFVGNLVEKRWGGEPWSITIGVLVGLAASFRQVYLMLSDKSRPGGSQD